MRRAKYLLFFLAFVSFLHSPLRADDVLSEEASTDASDQAATEADEEPQEDASVGASAMEGEDISSVEAVPVDSPSPGLAETLPEIVLRPMGAVSNVVGLGLFVAALPVTALASIPEPHDAVKNSLNGFVLGPFRYTFTRPIGVYKFRVNADE